MLQDLKLGHGGFRARGLGVCLEWGLGRGLCHGPAEGQAGQARKSRDQETESSKVSHQPCEVLSMACHVGADYCVTAIDN